MGDNVFFAQGNVTVTQTRFVHGGDTYAMANISSCRTRFTEHTERDDGQQALKTFAVWGSLIGGIALAILLYATVDSAVIAVVVAILGIVGAIVASLAIQPDSDFRIYHLYLGTNSGEVEAVASRDEDYILQIERAINDAMVARG